VSVRTPRLRTSSSWASLSRMLAVRSGFLGAIDERISPVKHRKFEIQLSEWFHEMYCYYSK